VSDKKPGEAEYYLESAFKNEEKCVRAAILSGQVAAARGNHLVAIELWRGIEEWAPEALGEVVGFISNSYAELGDQRGYRQFLESAIEKNPDARIISALVEVTQNRKGRIAGQRLLLEIVRKYPNLDGLYQLLRNRNAPELFKGESIDLELIATLLSQSMGQSREYQCRQCGFNSSSLHWQCPGCKEWGSVQKRVFGRERDTVGHKNLSI
jgi:lipopolysaccharide biosynthesis regulator YciM